MGCALFREMLGYLVIAITVRIFAEPCNCFARIILAQGAATPLRKSGDGIASDVNCDPVVLIRFAHRIHRRRVFGGTFLGASIQAFRGAYPPVAYLGKIRKIRKAKSQAAQRRLCTSAFVDRQASSRFAFR
jgi:hypothetical protein